MRLNRITLAVTFIIFFTNVYAGVNDFEKKSNKSNKNILLEKYYAKHIQLIRAWGVTEGNSEITIAILGSGLSYDLDEFVGKIAYEEDGSPGYDAFDNDMYPMDTHGVGTIIASIVAGNDYGIAPNAKLIPIRIFDNSGNTNYEMIRKATAYTIQRNAKILLIPFYEKMVGDTPSYCNELEEAARQGMLIVVPAGNNGSPVSVDDYPASCPGEFLEKNMITVAATDTSQALAGYSSFCSAKVEIAAPGSNISGIGLSGLPKVFSRGTAAAASLTAGVAALVWGHHPNYTAAQVREAIIKGSRYRPTLEGRVKSNGMLDAYQAVTLEL